MGLSSYLFLYTKSQSAFWPSRIAGKLFFGICRQSVHLYDSFWNSREALVAFLERFCPRRLGGGVCRTGVSDGTRQWASQVAHIRGIFALDRLRCFLLCGARTALSIHFFIACALGSGPGR